MDRRLFLRNAALLTAGAVAVDQLDIIERLGWKRRLFPGTDLATARITVPKAWMPEVGEWAEVRGVLCNGMWDWRVRSITAPPDSPWHHHAQPAVTFGSSDLKHGTAGRYFFKREAQSIAVSDVQLEFRSLPATSKDYHITFD